MSEMNRTVEPSDTPIALRRLAAAMILAPLLWGAFGTLIFFLVGGMSETSQSGTLEFTFDGMIFSFGLMFGFTFTFGLVGVAALWWFGFRSVVVWALTGGLLGALVATLQSMLTIAFNNQTLLIFFVIVGWGLFVSIRALAGIREADG